jgi:hypothetical protein
MQTTSGHPNQLGFSRIKPKYGASTKRAEMTFLINALQDLMDSVDRRVALGDAEIGLAKIRADSKSAARPALAIIAMTNAVHLGFSGDRDF